MSVSERYECVKACHRCFSCFGPHPRNKCTNDVDCSQCGKGYHHKLLCRHADTTEDANPSPTTNSNGYHSFQSSPLTLLPITETAVNGSKAKATLFFDGGSNTSYITHDAAKRLKAKRLSKATLDITAMGYINNQYHTCLYEVRLLTTEGEVVKIVLYGMDRITCPISRLDPKIIERLFPFFQCPSISPTCHSNC